MREKKNSIKMFYCLVFLLILCVHKGNGQKSDFIIKPAIEGNPDFIAQIGDRVKEGKKGQLYFEDLQKGQQKAKITIEDSAETTFSKNVFLKPQKQVIYLLDGNSEDGYQLSLFAVMNKPEKDTSIEKRSNTRSSKDDSLLLNNYNKETGCIGPLKEDAFKNVIQKIRNKTFEEEKLSLAKKLVDKHCFKASQVKKITNILDFADNKLNFAKYAYDRVFDIARYGMIKETFDFESSKKELDNYMKKKEKLAK